MADSGEPSIQADQGPLKRVFLGSDVAWSNPQVIALLHLAGQAQAPVEVLWSKNTSLDSFPEGDYRSVEIVARAQVPGVPDGARQHLQPQSADSLSHLFEDGEVPAFLWPKFRLNIATGLASIVYGRTK